MKKTKKFTLNELNSVLSGNSPAIFLESAHKYIYVDGKRTDTLESTTMTCTCKGLGPITLVFPPSNELLRQIENEYPFGSAIYIPNMGELIDVDISIYDNALSFKLKMKEL